MTNELFSPKTMSLLREHAEAIGVDEARVASDLLEMMVQERNRVTATPLLEQAA